MNKIGFVIFWRYHIVTKSMFHLPQGFQACWEGGRQLHDGLLRHDHVGRDVVLRRQSLAYAQYNLAQLRLQRVHGGTLHTEPWCDEHGLSFLFDQIACEEIKVRSSKSFAILK